MIGERLCRLLANHRTDPSRIDDRALAVRAKSLKKVTVLGGRAPQTGAPGHVGDARYEQAEFRRSLVFQPLAACVMRADWMASGWNGGVACAFGLPRWNV